MEDQNQNNQLDPRWQEQISKNWGNYCSSCGSLKNADSLKFMRRMGPAYQYVSECHSCGLKTVINLVPNLGMQVTQVRTDIKPSEFDEFIQPLNSNDYLEFYAKIKSLDSAEDLLNYFGIDNSK